MKSSYFPEHRYFPFVAVLAEAFLVICIKTSSSHKPLMNVILLAAEWQVYDVYKTAKVCLGSRMLVGINHLFLEGLPCT